ncbi:DMT family transporter [Azospirillum sp. TSA2s]|uniref:DMT family transporter n=1 Tax=Azospirillum sp. TSA2s TaxID=709810 RepID=UPI00145A793E|nr:DMT family transporter [Azospirillum sp. TSA2s]
MAGQAVLLMIVTAIVIPLLNATVKYLGGRYPVAELQWLRYAGHFLFMMVVFLPRYRWALFRTRRPDLQAARSVLFCASSLIMFYALEHTPLATATAIGFTAPLMVTALAPLLLRENVGPVRLCAVVVGFVGALIVVRPGYSPLHWSAALIFLSAMTSALTQILSRKLSGQDPSATSSTYMVLLGFALSSIPVPFVWVPPADLRDAILFLALGTLGGFGHYCLVRAFEVAPAPFVAPFIYLQIFGAAALGWLAFGQLPDLWTWVGSAVIIASGIVVLLRERRRGSTVAAQATSDD